MHPHAALLDRLYAAFARRDADAMAACYHPDATFEDPVFGRLDREGLVRMWAVLCARGHDLTIAYTVEEAGADAGRVRWEARYTFGGTGRRVRNRVVGTFAFADGLVLWHRDRFSFWRWAAQALGPPGLLLGWAPPFRAAVRRRAKRGVGLPAA